jgi:glycosyltransferase involved in cell wall biosynthesis
MNSNSAHPLISIVIPSFNQGQYIEQTLTSVLSQNYPNIELIIIDGGSTDNTPQIIEKYTHSITHYVSEPDNGQADAINKGFRLAKGDILAWLNSDDMYMPCAFSKVVDILGSSTEPRLVYGGCLRFTEGTPHAGGTIPSRFDADLLTYYDYVDQPSTFWTRSLWETAGELNVSYIYSMDWEWFIRASKVCQFIPTKEHLSLWRFYEHNKTLVGGIKRAKEIINIVETYASEEWKVTYRDVYKQIVSLKACEQRLAKYGLQRFRYLFFPRLYLKHGRYRTELAASWMLL